MAEWAGQGRRSLVGHAAAVIHYPTADAGSEHMTYTVGWQTPSPRTRRRVFVLPSCRAVLTWAGTDVRPKRA